MSLSSILSRSILIPSLLAAVLLGLAPPALAAPSEGPPPGVEEPIDGAPDLAGDLSRPEVPVQQGLAGPRAAYAVVDLGQGYSSNASEINEDGHISGTIFSAEGDLPVVWQGDRVVHLDRGGSRQVRAMAIADDGTVGGWEYDAEEGKRYAVTWTRDEDGEYGDLTRVSQVMRTEGSLHGGETQSLGANGLVHVTEPRQHVPVGSDLVWQAGAVTELAAPPEPGPYLATNDMNNHGQVVGMAGNGSDDIQAFVWNGGSPSALPEPIPNATITRGLAINDDGDVLGDSREVWYDADSAETIEREAGLWRNGTWTDLGNLYGDETTRVTNLTPWDVNDHDEVVGSAAVSVDGRGTDHAFLWRNGETIDLAYQVAPETGWELNSAHSINERGQIVGLGTLDGVQRAFLLDPTRPLLFVPGMGASILRSFDDPANPKDLWLACGEDRMQLSRFKEDDEVSADDVRAVDVTRFLECRGLSGRHVDALDAYGTMLEKLTTTYGYREYDVDGRPERRTAEGCDLTQRNDSPNLFVFAYDWRFDNAKSARELADYIGCIQQFYPGIEIDVVAHSMGSLVTRRYVLDHRRDTGLHKIVTIGAPWLGAPKLVDTLNTGNFTKWAAQGSSDVVRHVVGGFAAAHQLMAGPYYHALAGSVFAEDGWDYDRDGKATEEYDWANLKEALDERWSASTPATTVEEFHTNGGSDGQADWSNDSSGEDYTVIYGIQAGRNTIGKVKAVGETFCTPLELVCVTRQYVDQVMTQGDGTVPTTSANRTSGDDDLNGPAKVVPVPVHDSGDNDSVEHTALTRNPKVLETMIDTFRGVTDRTATFGKDESTEAAYRYVTVRGAQQIVLHDGQGRSDEPFDGEHRITLPGSQHLSQGPDGELVTMPADVGHPWKVTFTGSGKPASVKALEGTQERPEVAVQWRDLVVPEGHAAELLLTPTGLERLRIDTDGDGNVETTVPPTSDLSGADALDTQPPVVALAEVTRDGEKRYVVSATDGRDGTGVRRVLWSTDGEHYTEYAAPVRAPLAASIFAFAEDRAGNRSAVVELDLFAASKAPVTTATLDPAPSATGWSAGATTVALTAEASTGSEVAEIRYRATGAQAMEETIVAGDRAEVRVTAPGRTTLWFQAVAGDGATEPWQQKVLRIDAAAPTGRVLGPAPGSVVGVLGQVSGTAADDAAGVHQVEVLLERTSDGRTWDGGAWSQQATWLPARGTTEWRMTDVPGIDHLTPGAYAVRMRATDGAGRVTVTTAVTFTQAYAGRLAVTALGTVDGRVANTTATDINDDGAVVGGTGSFPMTANRWTNGVAGELRTPEGMADAMAHAVAADGSAVGYAEEDFTRRSAIRWTVEGDPKVLPHLDGAEASTASGVSAAGVVGQSGGRPVWWRDDRTVVALPTLQPGQTGEASDIDSTGTIVGHVVDAAGNSHAVAWTDGGRAVTDLGTLGGPYAAALGINEVGQVVGYSGLATGGMRAFVVDVREGEAMSEVYVPTKRRAQANDISDDGTIVGEYAMGDESRAAFLVTAAGEFQHLQLRLDPQTDWVLSTATGINGLGQIVGFGLKGGVGRAFLASTTHAPVAQDVVVDTDEDTAVTVRLTASDPDPGTRLAMEVVLQPAHGTLSAVDAGEVVYTPAPGFEGTDHFAYVAHDGALRSNAAMVTVRVRPGADPNQRPTAAVTAPATVPEGSTVEVDGSGSTDPDGTIAAYAWDLDGDGAFDDATGPTASLELGDQGLRSVALRVTDDQGAVAMAGTTVEAVNVAPMVSLPPSLQVAPGEPVRLQGTFADPGADSWTATVDSGDGKQPLSLTGKAFTVETTYAAAGNRSVTVEVCDGTDCATATTTVVVNAAWAWNGFFAPVDNVPTVNTVKAGQAIPMKFSVGGDRGLDILAPGYPVSIPHDCGTGQPVDDIEQTVTPGSSTLTYDAGTQRYQYVWKTQKSWANQCRTFTLKLADGSVHSAEFRFR